MPHYISILRSVRLEMISVSMTALETEIIAQHFEYLQAQVAKNVVVLAGRTLVTDETCFGIVIFKADSLESAYQFTQADPAIEHHVLNAEIFPFSIALASGLLEVET